MSVKADMFIEVSYEIGNKVGGIYTVLSTKASEMKKIYGQNYLTIGCFNPDKSLFEFEPRNPGELSSIFEELRKEGIKCYYGIWTVEGRPNTILVDIKDFLDKTNEIKGKLWEWYKIDSIRAGDDFNEPIVWSYAAGKLIEKILELNKNKKIVMQFHEWLSGGALLYLKHKGVKGTVFTTHATILGRSMANAGVSLQELIEEGIRNGKVIEDEEAYKYGVEAKHLTEKACAQLCDVFTTVSEVTAKEARFILGREADVILINGLNISSYPSMEELSYLHKKFKEELLKFIKAYFQPYYNLRLSQDPRIFFISGRYEFHNKGIDVFIEALGQLNRKLKAENYPHDAFFFIFVPTSVHGEKPAVLNSVLMYREMEKFSESVSEELKSIIIDEITRKKLPQNKIRSVLTSKYNMKMKNFIRLFSKEGTPPLCAYDLSYDETKDMILNALKENGLLNREEDRIKVIFYPIYISQADKLLSIDSYYDVIRGCSGGIFPSYYEPWGYTPHEAAANGLVAITTDYSGFGRFVLKNKPNAKGIRVLMRSNRSHNEIVLQLMKHIEDFVKTSKAKIGMQKTEAKMIVDLTDWSILIENYIKAHNMALR